MLGFDKVLYDSEDAVTRRLQERASGKGTREGGRP
jgi:hypothetical protein